MGRLGVMDLSFNGEPFIDHPEAVFLTVYGHAEPQGSKSARVVKGRAILTEGFGDGPRRRKAWREAVADAARAWQATNQQALLAGPLHLDVTFYLAKPKSAPKRVTHPTKKPDLSKLVRGVEDSLTGIVIGDDAQIVKIHAQKVFGDPPRATVWIRYIMMEGLK